MPKARASQAVVEVLLAPSGLARLSQQAVEVLVQNVPVPTTGPAGNRVSQEAVEALVSPNPLARVSQEAAEVLVRPEPRAEVSQEAVEVLLAPSGLARLSQQAVEVLVQNVPVPTTGPAGNRVSQEAVEALVSPNPLARVSQQAVEVLLAPSDVNRLAGALQGQLASAGQAAAVLKAGGSVSGQTALSGAVQAALRAAVSISGTLGLSAVLGAVQRLVGAVSGSAVLSGQIGVPAGAVSGAVALAGQLSALRRAVGSVAGGSTLSGVLTGGRTLTAALTGGLVLSAALFTNQRFVGAVVGALGLAGQVIAAVRGILPPPTRRIPPGGVGEDFTVVFAGSARPGQVARLSFSSRFQGGFAACRFILGAPLDELRHLFAVCLREGYREVQVVSREGAVVFEGFALTVTFRFGPIAVSKSLTNLANAVMVSYQDADTGAILTTGWKTDSDSIALFGRKEHVESAPNVVSPALADALADTILRERKIPRAELRLELSGSTSGLAALEVEAVGHFARTQWLVYASTDTTTADSAQVIWERASTTGIFQPGNIRSTGVTVSREWTTEFTTVQDAVMDLCKRGDSLFNPVAAQVWEGKRLDVVSAADLPVYEFDPLSGNILLSGRRLPPWQVRPGWLNFESLLGVLPDVDRGKILIGEVNYDVSSGRLSLIPYEVGMTEIVLARLGVL
jgi:hypothetical protein